ncbi:transcriptional regulator [Bradyrhizobium centrolobii]|uniref:Transcriptional regulator n=1 Tax=Bradyrhizobium centrolobii TaxID=1505087 RepID=A0A176YVB0_9BRAD|nr:winged helix-turn-helix domain-containing protein [Bradyrhizobium centrolobii]OAF10715.1 transcriptional regulator [Bradyrhizobium centrolobii]
MDSRDQSSSISAVAGSSAGEVFAFGPFHLDATQRRVERNGRPVQLSARAFDILLVLIKQAGTVISKSDLMTRAWPGAGIDEGSLRVHVAALRKALGDGNGGAKYLSTVSGQGYCFTGSVSRLEPVRPTPVKSTHVHHLPTLSQQVVGREQTIQEISEKLGIQRFVTIVGPGGIGKTTVAVSVGRALIEQFAGQVHFLSLGEIGDAALVPGMAASAFGLPARSNDPSGSLAAFLRDRRMLLILDCCEHVIETTAALAERLYKEAPELHILATSRELLRVEGEHIHRLLPLTIPPENAALTAASALTYPAVQLFVERAIAAGGEFELTDADASDVGNLCRRLDGIPHAIGLIAGHVSAYGAKAMTQLLDGHFNLLWEGRRTALPRHRSLRATIEWSYNLLSERERVALSRLSVFVGGFTLEAARAIAGTEETGDETTMACLDNLLAKSMLAFDQGSQSNRYRLLDATRAYAQEKLIVSADAEMASRCHASYFLNLLEKMTGDPGGNLSSIADQFGNIRSALTWCFSDQGDRKTGVALAVASIPLFFKLSLFGECQLWVTRGIEALHDTGGSVRHDLALHVALASARMVTGQIDESGVNCLNRAVELAEKLGDVPRQLRLIGRLHLLELLVGNFDDALGTARRGETIAIASKDSASVARMRLLLGTSCHYLGDVAASRSHIEAALLHPSLEGDVRGGPTPEYPGRPQITLARILWLQGYPDQATATARRAISDVIAINHPVMLCTALPWAFGVFIWNGEVDVCEEYIDRLLVETRRNNLAALQMVGEAMKGIALLARGETSIGLATLNGSVKKLQSQRYGSAAGLCVPLTEALAAADRADEALDTIDVAITRARHRNFMVEMPDMLRARAEALMRKDKPDLLQAERSFVQSVDLARQQGALGFELGAAIGLAKLWQRQGRRDEAHDMLAPIYGRFTEGFQTRSLAEARELLTELDAPRQGSLAAK